MVFTEEDKHAITFLRKNKNYGAKRLLKEFSDKEWTLGGLKALLSKIDKTGSFHRQPGSGRPRTATTMLNRLNRWYSARKICRNRIVRRDKLLEKQVSVRHQFGELLRMIYICDV